MEPAPLLYKCLTSDCTASQLDFYPYLTSRCRKHHADISIANGKKKIAQKALLEIRKCSGPCGLEKPKEAFRKSSAGNQCKECLQKKALERPKNKKPSTQQQLKTQVSELTKKIEQLSLVNKTQANTIVALEDQINVFLSKDYRRTRVTNT